MLKTEFKGVVTAVVTPFTPDDRPDLDNFRCLVEQLVEEGVDGVLLLGTTGEGTSTSTTEQRDIIQTGIEAAGDRFVLVGTGSSSLPDSIRLAQQAFELGADGVVTVPPFYYKKVTDQGLVSFFSKIMDEAVPEGKQLFLYDIPQVTGIVLSNEMIAGLLEHDEAKLGGVKDSTGKFDHAQNLITRFPELRIFVGTDMLLLDGMRIGAAGCITAGANLLAPMAVRVYQAFREGREDVDLLQKDLSAARTVLEKYTPFPASLKSVLAVRYGGDGWGVRPPLVALSEAEQADLVQLLKALELMHPIPWLG